MKSIYQKWKVVSLELKALKTLELKLRNDICASLLKDKLEGSITLHDEEVKIVATARITRSLDKQILEAIWEDLTDREKECVGYTPKLKLALYKPLEETGGKLMEAVTCKPAQSTLKIETEL